MHGGAARAARRRALAASPQIHFAAPDAHRPDDRDWVEQYGYGLVEQPAQSWETDPLPEPSDPNTAYLASLGPGERAACFEAEARFLAEQQAVIEAVKLVAASRR